MPGDGGLHGLSAAADRARRSPYPGLRPFGADEAELFCGRDDDATLIIANLRASPLTILYGPSGVGKSSLLQAGVAHRLELDAERARRAGVPAATVLVHGEWAGDPADALARRVEAATDGAVNGARPDGGLGLAAALDRWAASRRGRLLLVFDQFEEYLRLHPPGDRYGFDDLLCELTEQGHLPVHWLLALRDDALAELDRFEGRIPHLFDNYLRLPHLTPEAARRAIEEPVVAVNAWRTEAGLPAVRLQDGLADDVLGSLRELPAMAGGSRGREPAADAPVEPAYLQLVMHRLWEVETGGGSAVLRRETLQRLGGAEAIVGGHLDAAMSALTVRQQATAAAVLRYLVTPSGAKVRFTAEDLADYADRPLPAVVDVLEALSRPESRIIRRVPSPTGEQDRPGYELFHDVLSGPVRDWRLRMLAATLERRTTRALLALVAAGAAVLALVGYGLKPGPVQRLELRSADARFGVRGTQSPDRRIALVAIDARTLRNRPRGSTGNLGRAQQAELIRRIDLGSPTRIVEDVEFRAPVTEPGSLLLKRVLGRLGDRVVLATTRLDRAGRTTLFGEPGGLALNTAYSGGRPDLDGVTRRLRPYARLPSGFGLTATLPVAGAGVRVDPSRFPAHGAWIDFRGGPGTYRPISADDVLAGRVSPLDFTDKIVVSGATPPSRHDGHRTPAAGGSTMAGPEIQANEIATVLRGLPLKDIWPGVDVLLVVVLALLPAALAAVSSLRITLLVSAAAGVLLLVVAQLAFDAGRVIAVVYPLAALILSTLGVVVVGRLRGRPAQRRPSRPRISSSSVADEVAPTAPELTARSR